MRYLKLERAINRIDNELAAMNIAKKYLSNTNEINAVKDTLNKERQTLADEIYKDDPKSYIECCDVISELFDKKLGNDEQIELLETIKEKFGRQAPNVSKKSNGLNAWLRELGIEYTWVDEEESDWATLIITGFGTYK